MDTINTDIIHVSDRIETHHIEPQNITEITLFLYIQIFINEIYNKHKCYSLAVVIWYLQILFM